MGIFQRLARLPAMKGCDSLRAERRPKIILVCQQALYLGKG